jgi:transposase
VITFNRRTKVFACVEAVDMRASFDRLFSATKEILEQDPFSGHLFLFVNRVRDTCKALYWDGTGLVVLHKRLESGKFTRFNWLKGKSIEMTAAEFSLFFEGARFDKRFIESPTEIKRYSKQINSCQSGVAL